MPGNMPIDKEDLYLLMESYQNQIRSNENLLSQQAKAIEQQDRLLDKQKSVCIHVDEILLKLSACAESTGKYQEATALQLSKTHETIGGISTNMVLDHKGINHRIYFVYLGFGALITPLLYLLIRQI